MLNVCFKSTDYALSIFFGISYWIILLIEIPSKLYFVLAIIQCIKGSKSEPKNCLLNLY